VTGLRERFAQLLREAPSDAHAVEFENRWYDWADLRSAGEQLDRVLNRHGLGPDSRVGVVLENRPEHVAVLIATIATKRCVVTLSPLQPVERLIADIERSKVPVVVASAGVLERTGVADALAGGGVTLRLQPNCTIEDLGGDRRPESRLTNPGVMVEMMTSGTTGPPKRVDLADRQVDRAVSVMAAPPTDGRLVRESVSLVVAPLVHVGGLWSVLAPLYAGRRIAMLSKFAVDPWVDLVERHRPRAAGLVPAALRAVLDAEVDPARLSSLAVVTCGTTYCPPELASAFFERYGIRVLMTYGATEFAGAVAAWTKPMHEKWWDAKKGSVGRAVPGVDLRVVDEDGTVLAPGMEGILEIRSAQSPLGSGTWVRSSDRAVIDEDGFLYIKGRTDAAIIRGGFKVHPHVVEAALRRHPSVRDAAVVPWPDRRLGQVPVAAVEVVAGRPRPEPEELRERCREALTPYEVPTFVVVLDQLPRSPSAKVSRVDLMAVIESELRSRAERPAGEVVHEAG
jgi:Acyl-CoA synthetases (AMP-forming)/AMP-acid ligases II